VHGYRAARRALARVAGSGALVCRSERSTAGAVYP
jgi:hypothetical protein